MHIREYMPSDLPALIDLTIETFRPLFEQALPDQLDPVVYAHDHGDWQGDYEREVPALHDPAHNRFITVAEEGGQVVAYVGWNITDTDSGRMEMVAVRPTAQARGVGTALCREVLDQLRARGATVVHIGTGGDDFHAPARRLYESLGFTGYPVYDYTRPL